MKNTSNKKNKQRNVPVSKMTWQATRILYYSQVFERANIAKTKYLSFDIDTVLGIYVIYSLFIFGTFAKEKLISCSSLSRDKTIPFYSYKI